MALAIVSLIKHRYSQTGWTATSYRHRVAGRQSRPAGGRVGDAVHLRAGLRRIQLWLLAWKEPTSGARPSGARRIDGGAQGQQR